MPKQPSHDREILLGLGKGNWALYWADQEEEKGRSFSGQDLYEICPNQPPWAKKWSRNIADQIVRLNKTSLADLYKKACEAGFDGSKESFGSDLGLQVAGHGIAWDDNISGVTDLKIELPYAEFYN